MPHLMRTVPRQALAAHMRPVDAAVWQGAPAVLTLPSGVGESGADMKSPDQACNTLGRQMMLPLRKGGLGLRMQSDKVSDVAFVADTGQTERDASATLCPSQQASGASVREPFKHLH